MPWSEKKQILERLGIKGFESEDHFNNWLEWECDDRQLEIRIKKALCNQK